MKLTVLTENSAGAYFLAEHGLSYYIEYDKKKILFDTGASDVFLKNAKQLNINLEEADLIVLSHGHWDHGNGLKYLKGQTLLTHPSSFIKRFRKGEKRNIGLELSYEQVKDNFTLISSKEPYYISENIIFLGEIPHTFEFEERTVAYIDEESKIDYILDDSAIAIIKDEKLIIVSGCAHSGICNIIEYAKELTGINKVKTVIGGFHLKKQNYQTKKTVNYFKDSEIEYILPSHCTQLPALSMFYDAFKIEHVKTGMIFKF